MIRINRRTDDTTRMTLAMDTLESRLLLFTPGPDSPDIDPHFPHPPVPWWIETEVLESVVDQIAPKVEVSVEVVDAAFLRELGIKFQPFPQPWHEVDVEAVAVVVDALLTEAGHGGSDVGYGWGPDDGSPLPPKPGDPAPGPDPVPWLVDSLHVFFETVVERHGGELAAYTDAVAEHGWCGNEIDLEFPIPDEDLDALAERAFQNHG